MRIKNLHISNMHRRENQVPVSMVHVNETAEICIFSMEHVSQENTTQTPIPILWNEGKIGKLYLYDIQSEEELIRNEGTIDSVE